GEQHDEGQRGHELDRRLPILRSQPGASHDGQGSVGPRDRTRPPRDNSAQERARECACAAEPQYSRDSRYTYTAAKIAAPRSANQASVPIAVPHSIRVAVSVRKVTPTAPWSRPRLRTSWPSSV